jgi:hypothetical protein
LHCKNNGCCFSRYVGLFHTKIDVRAETHDHIDGRPQADATIWAAQITCVAPNQDTCLAKLMLQCFLAIAGNPLCEAERAIKLLLDHRR